DTGRHHYDAHARRGEPDHIWRRRRYSRGDAGADAGIGAGPGLPEGPAGAHVDHPAVVSRRAAADSDVAAGVNRTALGAPWARYVYLATDILTTLEFDRVRESLERHCQFS